MQYQSVITLLGQAKIADAIAAGPAINITQLSAGDGNGAPAAPLETQTALVNEVWRGGVLSASRDPANPTHVIVQALIPVDAGPFTIRELALWTSDGQCFAVMNTPEIVKTTAAQGATQDITVSFRIVVDTAAAITVSIDPAQLVSIAGMLRAPFIAIDGFIDAPPANPGDGDLYVVGAGAAGAFGGLMHKFVQWNGTVWVNAIAVKNTIVGDNSNDSYWKRTATGWVLIQPLSRPVRIRQTANTTFYVNGATGNNTNDGLTPGTAFATIQRAVDYASDTYDGAGYTISIIVADGVYGPVTVKRGAFVDLDIIGNVATPANVTIAGGAASAFDANEGANVTISGFTLTGLNAIVIHNNAQVYYKSLRFGAVTYYQIYAFDGGLCEATGDYAITGGGASHVRIDGGGQWNCRSAYTVTLTGAPAFSVSFITVNGGAARSLGTIWSGSATGVRYQVDFFGTIFVNGAGANHFPGSTAGTIAAGFGKYA